MAIQSLRSQPGIPSVLRHYFPSAIKETYSPYLTEEREALPLFLFRRKRMDCHDRHDCNGNCNTYLPPSARLLHRSVLYRTFSRASRHRATLHLVLVEEQITPDSPIPILCRLRQSADRLALYPFRLIAIPRQFPSHAVALGPYPHRHLPSQTSP